jgi:hypothetical protein
MVISNIKYVNDIETFKTPLVDYEKYDLDIKASTFNYFNRKLFNSFNYEITNLEDYSFIKKNEVSKEQMLMEFRREFRKISSNEDLEFGKIGITTELVRKHLKIDKDVILKELQAIGLENIEDKDIVFAVIHSFAHLDYDLVYPAGPVFALAICGVHKDIEIKDFAIQSFEIWNNKSSLTYLKAINIENSWLKEYLNEVILLIEEK